MQSVNRPTCLILVRKIATVVMSGLPWTEGNHPCLFDLKMPRTKVSNGPETPAKVKVLSIDMRTSNTKAYLHKVPYHPLANGMDELCGIWAEGSG
jgi:hypothetical protein